MAEACYVPQYLPASFKGVPFDAMEADSEHGRRGAEGEFPFGESTAYADLGRKIRRFTVQGKLVRNSHVADAELMIAAVESPGPGMLIHPTRGAVMVACTTLKVSDKIEDEQGVTYLDFEFVEGNEVGTSIPLGASFFGISMAGVSVALEISFKGKYSKPVRFNRKNLVNNTAREGLAIVKDEFARSIRGTKDNRKWSSLSIMDIATQDPANFANADNVYELTSQSMLLMSSNSVGEKKYQSFRKIVNWSSQSSELPFEAADAQNSVYALFRILGAGYMARAALETPTTTLQAALDQYDQVMSVLDQEMKLANQECDSSLYLELDKFRAKVATALLDRAYLLPALIEYEFNRSVISLVAAHEIFRDARKFPEIEMRNPFNWPFSLGTKVVASRR